MNNTAIKTVCFTGHREIPFMKQSVIKDQLKRVLKELIEQGSCFFCAGGALGFDTLAAQAVLDLREQYPQIKLILVLPCLSQTKNWDEKDMQIYEYIKEQADRVVYTSREYTRGCMHKRNRNLVDNSSTCVCYLSKTSGGTAYTVEYARKKGLRIINIES